MELNEYLNLERELPDLDLVETDGVPIWRLVRLPFRWEIMNDKPFTVKPSIKVVTQASYFLRSFFSITKLRFSRNKIGTLFFPHPRLFLVGDKYMERLSDPLIACSSIGDDYLIFERHQNGIHKRPRLHGDKVVYLDFIDDLAMMLRPFYRIWYKGKYKGEIKGLCDLLSTKFVFDRERVFGIFLNALTDFRVRYRLFRPILSKMAPNRVFVAPRTTYQYVIAISKKLGIESIELQHGVTVGETELYSGTYDERIDPDLFFSFGKANLGPHFGMPASRLRNVGFPFKEYISSLGLAPFDEKYFLVISEPHISDQILSIVIELSRDNPEKFFHIRCHPQEKLSDEMMRRFKDNDHILVVDNKTESFCALSRYQYVLGENSSVMYEAMSLGKKVGRFNYGGLHVVENNLIHGGRILNSPADFVAFSKEPYDDSRDSKEIYSDFDKKYFDSILV